MKIIFAGTSHGIPEKGAFCTSTFVSVGEKLYIFDAGAPISGLLLNYGFSHGNVAAVFNTHEHADHIDGLPEFCNQITWYYKDAKPKFFFPEQKAINILNFWAREMNTPDNPVDFDMTVYNEGLVYDDGFLRVTARKTDHLPFSYAFLIEGDGKRVLLTGDMSFRFSEYTRITNGESYDIVICEAAHFMPDDDEPRNTIGKTDAKRIIFNHISPNKKQGFEPLVKDGIAEFAYDGMIIEL